MKKVQLAHSRSFLANQKARNAIVEAENLLILNIVVDVVKCTWKLKGVAFLIESSEEWKSLSEISCVSV